MNEQPPDNAAQPRCPNCDNPLLPDTRFCENCGAKIEPRTVCRRCGAPLLPDAKFCEKCGVLAGITLISRKSTIPPAERVATKPPAPAVTPKPEAPVIKKATIPPIAAPVKTATAREATPSPKIPTIPRSAPVPDEQTPKPLPEKIRTLPRSAPVPDEQPAKPVPEKIRTLPRSAPVPDEQLVDILSPESKASPSKMPLIIGGVVGVVVLIVILLVVVMPMLSSPTGTSSGSLHPVVTVPPVTTSFTATLTATPQVTTVQTPKITQTASPLLPGPTQTLPVNQVLYVTVDKDSVSGEVTVIATGPSRNVVDDIEILLTRSDGLQQTGHITPSQKVDEVTIPGTRGTDRIEVTVRFYSGATYKVIDKLLEIRSHS